MDIARKQFSAYDHENKNRDWEHVHCINMKRRDEKKAEEMSSGASTVACLRFRALRAASGRPISLPTLKYKSTPFCFPVQVIQKYVATIHV
jgi:hypothetical protein